MNKDKLTCITDIIIAIIFVVLFANLLIVLVFASWENPITLTRGIYNFRCQLLYLGFSILCILWLLKNRIIKLVISKEGLQAELQQVQIAKEEVLALKDEIRDLYKELLVSYVTLIENSGRWSGWSKARYEQEMQRIQAKCDILKLSVTEQEEVFCARKFWVRMAQIEKIKIDIVETIQDAELVKHIEHEWDKIVHDSAVPSAIWLEPLVANLPLEEEAKKILLDKIRQTH